MKKSNKKHTTPRRKKDVKSTVASPASAPAAIPENQEVTCRKCGTTYVPNFINDFYPDGADPKVGLCEQCMMAKVFAPKAPSDLPTGHDVKVCRFGQGPATCAFLALSPSPGGMKRQCTKGSDIERIIRGRLAEGSMNAKGENCSGPPDFKPDEVIS